MGQGIKNIVVDQGADRSIVFQCKAADKSASDLSGYTSVSVYIAPASLSSAALEVPSSFVDSEGLASESGTSAGQIKASFSGALTRPLAWANGVWQAWVTAPSGDRFPLLGGQITIRRQVPADEA